MITHDAAAPDLVPGWTMAIISPSYVVWYGPQHAKVTVKVQGATRSYQVPRIVLARPFYHGSRPVLSKETIRTMGRLARVHLLPELERVRNVRAVHKARLEGTAGSLR